MFRKMCPILVAFLLLAFVGLWYGKYVQNGENMFTYDNSKDTKGWPEKKSSLLRDMSDPFKTFPRVVPHACINITQSHLVSAWSVMCVDDPTFNDVARSLLNKGAWEPRLSKHLVKAMLNYPNAVLIDIGSNIGPHSLTVAAMQREVVVVDAVFYNLALISLSHKITNKGNVTILYNSISDQPGELLYPYLTTWARHRQMAGATFLVTKEDLDSGKYMWKEVIGAPVVSVTTKDIFDIIGSEVVIIKIDVEGYECKALQHEILDQSTGKYVPYIFMEWVNLRKNNHHTCDHYQQFMDSFTSCGYSPHETENLLPMELSTHTDWYDVVWIHGDAAKIVVYV